MITDGLLQLSSAQAVTASAVSTNTIDLGTARDIGSGEPLYAVITVDESFSTATSVTINVITSAAADLSSAVTLSSTQAIPIANLLAGRKPIVIDIPSAVLIANPIGQRYLGLSYTIGGSNATAGKFTANVTHCVQDIGKHYASGFTVA
jgi:hypothetical protein